MKRYCVYDYEYATRALDVKKLKIEDTTESRGVHYKKSGMATIFVSVDAKNSHHKDFFFHEVVHILTSNSGQSFIQFEQTSNTVYAAYHSNDTYSDFLVFARGCDISALLKMVNSVLAEAPDFQINCAIVINTDTFLQQPSYEITMNESIQVANHILSEKLPPLIINELIMENFILTLKDLISMDLFGKLALHTRAPFYTVDLVRPEWAEWFKENF